MTLPSVKTTYTERRSPDGEPVQESRSPRQAKGPNPGGLAGRGPTVVGEK